MVWPLQHLTDSRYLVKFLNIFLSSFQSHTPSLNNIRFRGLGRQYGTICSVSWPLMGQPFHDRGRMRMCGLDSYIQWGSDTHWLLWSSHLYSPSILWALSSKPGLFCANMSVPFWHVRNCRWYSSNSCLRERGAPFPALGPTWMPLGPGQDALGSVLLIGRFFHQDGRQEARVCHLLEKSQLTNHFVPSTFNYANTGVGRFLCYIYILYLYCYQFHMQLLKPFDILKNIYICIYVAKLPAFLVF